MTKQEKIKALEKEFDNLTDRLRNPHGCPDRISIMITKEIIQAQITALGWEFDKDDIVKCSICGAMVEMISTGEICPHCFC